MPHRSHLSILDEAMQRIHVSILAPDHKCSSVKHLHDKTIRLLLCFDQLYLLIGLKFIHEA